MGLFGDDYTKTPEYKQYMQENPKADPSEVAAAVEQHYKQNGMSVPDPAQAANMNRMQRLNAPMYAQDTQAAPESQDFVQRQANEAALQKYKEQQGLAPALSKAGASNNESAQNYNQQLPDEEDEDKKNK